MILKIRKSLYNYSEYGMTLIMLGILIIGVGFLLSFVIHFESSINSSLEDLHQTMSSVIVDSGNR